MEDIDPERVLIAREDLTEVLAYLDELGERTKNIFILFRLEGMRQKEIAALYGIGLSTVEKHVMAAAIQLAKTVWFQMTIQARRKMQTDASPDRGGDLARAPQRGRCLTVRPNLKPGSKRRTTRRHGMYCPAPGTISTRSAQSPDMDRGAPGGAGRCPRDQEPVCRSAPTSGLWVPSPPCCCSRSWAPAATGG